jgi:hypothetical protein
MRPVLHPIALLAVSALLLSACGGGGGGGGGGGSDAGSAADTATTEAPAAATAPAAQPQAVVSPTLTVTDRQRAAAAATTSQNAANACAAIRPFYWEVGNRDGKLVSGSVASSTTNLMYSGSTAMSIASASKWVYGAYVAQKQGGALSDGDRKFLEMRSGYVSLQSCDPGQTVDSCLAAQNNGAYTPAADGLFDYDSGHMEKHASLLGLGAMKNAALAAEIQSQIGSDVALAYTQPLLAGGLRMTPDAFALFLRKMLGGQLVMGSLLGSGAVCTNAATCGTNQAIYAPVPSTESWHYSLAHWVEDDPLVGDGAFSSAGAFGFYPWIDASKTNYGIVARVAQSGSGYASAQCGRLIRKAWATGVAR